MISEYPEDYELIGFFEAMPTTLDPGVPWPYNTLIWDVTRGDLRLRCEITASYGDLAAVLMLHGVEILHVSIRNADRIRFDKRAGHEVLHALSPANEFFLQLKPNVHMDCWALDR